MKFFNYHEKLTALKNCKTLKGTTNSIRCDYAKETREKLKTLSNSASVKRADGDDVFLVHDKLYINNQMYE